MQTIHGRRVLGSTRLLKALSKTSSLDRPTKLCYLLMCAYGRDSGECYAAIPTLAQDLRVSKDQAKRYLRQLRRAGLVEPRWVAGKPTHYVFLWHAIFQAAISTV